MCELQGESSVVWIPVDRFASSLRGKPHLHLCADRLPTIDRGGRWFRAGTGHFLFDLGQVGPIGDDAKLRSTAFILRSVFIPNLVIVYSAEASVPHLQEERDESD